MSKDTLAKRTAGTHEINVVAAAEDLSVLAAESAVTIEVKYRRTGQLGDWRAGIPSLLP